jgi:RNA-binding protein
LKKDGESSYCPPASISLANSHLPLTGKQRAALRAEAHHLRPAVHVGHHGLTDELRTSLDDALRTHELVKVQLAKRAELNAKAAASALAAAVLAEVVQVIGHTTTLYRANPALEHRAGEPPAWRR